MQKMESIAALCLFYIISLHIYNMPLPALKVFHFLFDEGENHILQMGAICMLCLLLSLLRDYSAFFIILTGLAPYGMLSMIVVMSEFSLGIAVNLAVFMSLPFLYCLIKEPLNTSFFSISKATLSDIFEEACDFISWSIFPAYTIFAANLLFIIIRII